MTIFTANPTALIAQPGRAVNTFPSGLVRVDQTYLGLTAQAATHRTTLAIGNNMPDGNSSPCIDGLKIFPEAQERRREDGFTEFIVSAYGRCNATGQKTFGEELVTTTVFHSLPDAGAGISAFATNGIESYADSLTWQFCVPKNSSVAVTVGDIARVFEFNGTQLQTMTFYQSLARFFPTLLTQSQGLGHFKTKNPRAVVFDLNTIVADLKGLKVEASSSTNLPAVEFKVEAIKKTNFGSFDEWTVSYQPYPPIFDFVALGDYSIWQNPGHAESSNLANLIDNTITNVSLGEAWALNTSTLGLGYTPPTNYSQLILNTWVNTPTGRAKLGIGPQYANSVVDGYTIATEFGYYIPNSLGNGTVFTPFARPAGGTWNGLGQGPQTTITQGAATWDLDMGPDVGGNDGAMFFYVYNLKAPINNSRALYMAFRWEQNYLENGVTTTFEKTAQAIYEPEVLVPQGQ